MRIDCIIVEDEPLAQERIKGYIQKLPDLNLLFSFDNGLEALLYLRSNPVDLIFLDINMGEFSGIRLLETINRTARVIIITAYHEYALKGFELNVTDYLLKPVSFERFLQAVDRVQANVSVKEAQADKKILFVKTEHRLEKVLLDEVLYIEGMRDYRRLQLINRQIMTLRTFREFEQEIPPATICRVHKSFMVALDKIESIEKDRISIRQKLIPISETYKKTFFELIDPGR